MSYGITRSRMKTVCLAMLLFALPPAHAQEFMGVVYPNRDLTLSLGVSGLIASRDASIGQRVRAGEQLLRLEADIQATEVERRRVIFQDNSSLTAEEARLEIVERLYLDAQRLFDDVGSISGQEVSQLRMEYVTAQGRLEQLRGEKKRQELEYRMAQREHAMRTLRAPIDGMVTELELDVGEWTDPGETALRLVDASSCELRVSVDEVVAYQLVVGMALPVYIEGLPGGEPRNGTITFVSAVADAASGLVQVRVGFPNEDLAVRPGSRGRIVLEMPQ
jgi:RND family efflux transporter MFP subunit